jgi:hypothetical protein
MTKMNDPAPALGEFRTVKRAGSDWLTDIEMWDGEKWVLVRPSDSDSRIRRIYSSFLNRLYIYRNITSDHTRIQLWLSKLDEWGRGCGDGWETEEEWESIMDLLDSPEVPQ